MRKRRFRDGVEGERGEACGQACERAGERASVQARVRVIGSRL